MARFVFDASVALAFLLPGEHGRERALVLVGVATRDKGRVPAIWPAELGHGLVKAEQTRRLPLGGAEATLPALLMLLAIVEIDTNDEAGVLARRLALARAHRLSFYDATYLELAQRLNLPLATFDLPLRRAAAAERVALID